MIAHFTWSSVMHRNFNALITSRTVTGSLLVLLLLRAVVCAENVWPETWVDDADLHGIFFIDSTTGWAVGDRGAIWHTQDGVNWRQQKSPVGQSLLSVHFIDAKNGWIVGGRIPDYSQQTEGCVLRTDDGGETWVREKSELPFLRSVEFQDSMNGIAAGDCTAMYPSGFFQTKDGGKNWRTVAIRGRSRWQAMVLRENRGLLLDESGAIRRFGSDHDRSLITTGMVAQPAMNDIGWLDDSTAMACGDEGKLLLSLDAGSTWESLESEGIPIRASLRTLAAHGPMILVGGTGGVWRSTTGGRSWQIVSADCPEVHDIQLVDSKNGYAVGAFGAILKTTDGGITWDVVRGKNRRLTALGIFADADSVPWSIVSNVGAGLERRFRVVTLDNRVHRLRVSAEDRTHGATLAAGGSHGVAWAMSSEREFDSLVDTIKFELSLWKPDVVFVRAPEDDPSAERLVLATQKAKQSANASVRILYAKQTHQGQAIPASEARRSSAGLALNLGATIEGLAREAQLKLDSQPSTVASRTMVRSENQSKWESLSSAMRGIRQHRVTESRRRIKDSTPENFRYLQRKTQIRTAIQTLIERAKDGSVSSAANLSQVATLAAELDPRAAALEMYRLAHAYFLVGDLASALEAINSIVADYPAEDVALAAIGDAIRWTTSAELMLKTSTLERKRLDDLAKVESAAANQKDVSPTPKVQTFNRPYGQLKTLPASYLVRDRMHERAPVNQPEVRTEPVIAREDLMNPEKWIDLAGPIVQTQHGVAFNLAAYRRNSANPGQRQLGLFQRLMRTGPSLAWRSCANEELRKLQPERASTKPNVYSLRSRRPRLDGKVDDDAWMGKPLLLQHGKSQREAGRRASPARLWLAHDDEYLFFAVAARCEPGCDYKESAGAKRERDTELGGNDRVEVYLDTNRDYASAWQLTVDHRGWANENILGDSSWNPHWHIAAAKQELADGSSLWTIEAAIPFTELSAKSPQAGESWAIAVRRAIPSYPSQSWPVAAEKLPRQLEESGIITFVQDEDEIR